VLKWLSQSTTETLQALLNQKSKGCLKKHSLSLESQRSARATHNPKVAGSSPAAYEKGTFEGPFCFMRQQKNECAYSGYMIFLISTNQECWQT
jgi:hypothetical protein